MSLFIAIGVPVLLILISSIVMHYRKKSHSLGKTPYVDALHLLLEGRKDEAMEILKKILRQDTENIMAYIVLGDIFREKGFPMKAAKVHQSLLVRSDLTDQQTNTVLTRLIQDYQLNGSLEQAVEVAEKLANRNKKELSCQKLLLSLYEEKGDWDKAFFYRQAIGKWMKKQRQDILALYKVNSGIALAKRGHEREGRIRYREGIRIDKNCIPAYLNWGDSYRREDRDEDALQVYREFANKIPEWAHLVFDRLKEVLYDLGRYGEIEEIYLEVMQKKPKNPQVYLNLAELYKSQGKVDKAIELVKTAMDQHADSVEAKYALIHLLNDKGDLAGAFSLAAALLDKVIKHKTAYRCSECRHESQEPLWHCPNCSAWNSFLDKAS